MQARVEAVWMRVGALVRRGWPASVALVLLVGLGAGVAMEVVAAGRRTTTVYDRFVEFADPPELALTFCPPGMTEVDEESLLSCLTYPGTEERDVIADLPEVAAAASGAFRGVSVAPAGQPDRFSPATSFVVRDHVMHSVDGQQLLVEGRWYRPDRLEVVINELLAERSGLGPGDEVVLTFAAPEELGNSGGDARFTGPSSRATVVGVGRGLEDLRASSGTGAQIHEQTVLAGPAIAAATPEALGFEGVLVNSHVPEAELLDALTARFGDQPFNATPAVGEEQRAAVREAISYEGRGVIVVGVLLALAAAVIAGQTIARQTRREFADVSLLRAIGFTRAQLWLAAAARGASIGLPAAVLGVLVAIALSPLGPVGVGRLAEPDPGVRVDVVVIAVGAVAVLALSALSAWSPVRRAVPGGPVSEAAHGRGAAATRLPPAVGVGVRLGVSGRRGVGLPTGTAVAGVALAAAATVAALGLTASFDSLRSHPDRFGAPWDLSFGEVVDGNVDGALQHIVANPDVRAAAALAGTNAVVGGRNAWVHAFRPVEGIDSRIQPPISDGRAPDAVDEIALGSVTMRELGVGLGDEVEVRSAVTTGRSSTLTVVGAAVINDVYEHSPGSGGVVSPEWIERWAPEVTPDPYVVALEPGADVDALAAAIEADSPSVVQGPVPQTAVQNVGRIRELPYLLAAFVGVLAAGAFAHALLLSVRRQHGQLAVLRALGFTRDQVGLSVSVHATVLAGVAVAVGVPLGVVAGRVGWRLIAEQLGVVTVEVTPLLSIAAVTAAVLLLANLVATVPAWRARRLGVADTLRTE